MNLADIMAVFNGSDGDATRALYERLEQMTPRGFVAVKLMQASKSSSRAKLYRGRHVRSAYEKKDWAIGELARALVAFEDVIPSWGWGWDKKAINFENVLYVDIPGAGQVSFHTSYRRDGPDYAGIWGGVKNAAPDRICRWAEAVLDGRELATEGEQDGTRHGRDEAGAAAGAGQEQEGPAEPDVGRQETLDL